MLIEDVDRGLTAALFAFAAATDWVDGYLARRWEVTTKLGSFLDTTADKLLVTGVLIALVAVERASPWVAIIIIGRELMVLGLRGVIAAERHGHAAVDARPAEDRDPVPGDPAGDPAAGRRDRRRVRSTSGSCSLAAAITVASAVDYFSSFADSLSRAMKALPDRRERVPRRRAARRAARARRRGRRARALRRGGGQADRGAARRSSAATRSTRTRSSAGMQGCDIVYHVAGINTMCPTTRSR